MRAVEIKVDSVDVVNGIKNKKLGNLIRRALMNKIQTYMEMDWEIDVRHTFREDNHCVDALAKNGFELYENYCFFDSYPPRFRHLFDAALMEIPVSLLIVMWFCLLLGFFLLCHKKFGS